jgi:FkbM family methyltransferase
MSALYSAFRKLAPGVKARLMRWVLGFDSGAFIFSQAGEDYVLHNIFYDKLSKGQPGFFVDVGAFHPYRWSNTYFFYRHGWRGINVDARPGFAAAFQRIRPRDIAVEAAISEREEELVYNYFGEHAGKNSFSQEYLKHVGKPELVREIRMRTRTLKSVLDERLPPGQSIDFMSVDVEGFDLQVLRSNDWSRYRPWAVAVELPVRTLEEAVDSPITRYMKDQGYEARAKTVVLEHVGTVVLVDQQARPEPPIRG